MSQRADQRYGPWGCPAECCTLRLRRQSHLEATRGDINTRPWSPACVVGDVVQFVMEDIRTGDRSTGVRTGGLDQVLKRSQPGELRGYRGSTVPKQHVDQRAAPI